MKKINSFFATLIAIAFLASCVEEKFEPIKPAQDGDAIMFSAVSGYEAGNLKTKTEYSGEPFVEDNGKTYERINWVEGDVVGIYCHTANNKQSADYVVNLEKVNTGDKYTHTAALYPHAENSGLQWNGTGEHNFYAIYPSPTRPDATGGQTSLENRVDISYNEDSNTATVAGYVATNQVPVALNFIEDKKHYLAKPDMRYSYMVSRATATPEDGHVELTFTAISTAVEIDVIRNTEDVKIDNIMIETISGAPLSGDFTCEIDNNGKPIAGTAKVTNGVNRVNIQLEQSVTLTSNNPALRVTALLLPVSISVDDLNILVVSDGVFVGKLKGVSLSAHKKHYLKNLQLPTQVEFTGSNWVTMLPGNTIISGLSIPGTANSFSYKRIGDDGANTVSSSLNTSVAQCKNFTDQWNMGVRCFEFVSDRNTSETIGENAVDLGSEHLKCNGVDLNISFQEAFNLVNSKVKDSKEFAMIICTYQPQGTQGNARDPEVYMSQLRKFYNNNKANANFVLYKPGLTIDDVKGSILLIARPSQEGEDSDLVVDKAIAGETYNILTIKGWGSLPDKWWRRGYNAMLFKGADTSGERIDSREGIAIKTNTETGEITILLGAMEDYMYGTNYKQQSILAGGSAPFPKEEPLSGEWPSKGKDAQEFGYPTDAPGFQVWVQEWRRVIKEDRNISTRLTDMEGFLNYTTYNLNFSFKESYKEKQIDIEHTFEKSVNDKSGKYVYFNSLDGFYMLTDNYDSYGPYWKGNLGDIGSYSIDINKWFYKKVAEWVAQNKTGTMGVILIDRVGQPDNIEIPTESSSAKLATAIYLNNLKYNLASGDTDSVINNGGDAISFEFYN